MRGAWRLASSNEGRSHASLKGHPPLPVADGPMVARAELNTVRSVSHCRAVRLEFPILLLHPGLRQRGVAPDVWPTLSRA